MSGRLVNLIYGKIVGEGKPNAKGQCASAMLRKIILVRLADRANDDGSSIYTSHLRITAEIEGSRSSVVPAIESLKVDGLLVLEGHRRNRNGGSPTPVYRISVRAVKALADAWEECPEPDTLDPELSPRKLPNEWSDPDTAVSGGVSGGGGVSVLQADTNLRTSRTRRASARDAEAPRSTRPSPEKRRANLDADIKAIEDGEQVPWLKTATMNPRQLAGLLERLKRERELLGEETINAAVAAMQGEIP